jgi:hypothetical protein
MILKDKYKEAMIQQDQKKVRVRASKPPRLSKPSGKKASRGGKLLTTERAGEPEIIEL